MSAARILVVDDEAEIRELLKDILADEGYDVEVAADAAEARASRAEQDPDLVLLDIWMPDTDGITLLREWTQIDGASCPVVMMSGHGTVETAVEATRLGAFDFIEKPLSLVKLLHTVERALESGRSRQRQTGRTLVPQLIAPVGRSRVMRALREQVEQIAPHETPVLIVGEPGSGREAFARYLHSLSPRVQGPFVQLVATGVSDEGAAAILHGTQDADGVHAGVFEQASGGILFINGIEDLPPKAQGLLAAALETQTFARVGGATPIKPDVRVVASATPCFLSADVRQELLSRLSIITLNVPPLREYAQDVPELLRHYADRLVDEQHLPLRRFSVAAQNRLRNYPWPGNVRELRNLVQRLLILGGEEEIRLDEIERELTTHAPMSEPLVKQDLLALPLREAREHFERAYLQQQLILCNGKVGQLAKRVGMERTHLYRKLRSLGVDFRQLAEE
ncbi:nitrogen assimilation regulatory protein NtrX [Steroidobacter denitrificans]|uniref:Nitrogen assimilation regulatory protein NtrX n=1 Tax=Steroidobacter denitrificans TaxID=465721 RepID=A0A127F7M1_STEDE|nr:sigma-54 dependent transcriptional regulator [Steroidobacter denitrificans]AMN45621.1 nitrogen assimilation regulatory protein NtrX [Steroidobacter denitrificans]